MFNACICVETPATVSTTYVIYHINCNIENKTGNRHNNFFMDSNNYNLIGCFTINTLIILPALWMIHLEKTGIAYLHIKQNNY